MLGDKKIKIPFGQRKPSGNFGKKPSKGNFGKKIYNSLDNKVTTKKIRVLTKDIPQQKERLRARKSKENTPLKSKTKLAKKSTKNLATAEELEFLAWVRSEAQYLEYPCFVCGKFRPGDGIKWHHIKEFSSDLKNHKRIMPLCDEECHRLGKVMSAHGTPVKFREAYPMKVQYAYGDSIWNSFQAYKANMA